MTQNIVLLKPPIFSPLGRFNRARIIFKNVVTKPWHKLLSALRKYLKKSCEVDGATFMLKFQGRSIQDLSNAGLSPEVLCVPYLFVLITRVEFPY